MNKVQNSPNFGAIKLSKISKPHLRQIGDYLDGKGFYDLGLSDCFGPSVVLQDKKQVTTALRDNYIERDDEFVKLKLREAKEAYIVGASPMIEQKMLPLVQEIDPKAGINILM